MRSCRGVKLRTVISCVLLTEGLVLSPARGEEKAFAREKLELPAAKGDADASYLLGRAYDKGEGVPRDRAKALTYYRQAAERGNAKAQNNLASFYLSGDGGAAPDKAAAERWLRKAALQNAPLAQDNLGLLLAQENDSEAATWFRKAAAQGLLSAQLHLGNAYYNGSAGLSKDYAAASKWFQKAAEQKSDAAQNVLGVMYQNGLGVTRDTGAAIKWFRRAAEQGNAKAQSNLGQMYCAGQDIATNPLEGYMWLALSAEKGEVTAVKFLADYQTGLTQEQVDAGRRLVRQYHEKHGPTAPVPEK